MTLLEEEGLQLREFQRLEGLTDRVWGFAWNPATGTAGIPAMFASCGGDKTVRIWQQRSPSSTSFDCNVSFRIAQNFRICDRLTMTAGTEVVCNDVVKKVEIEEKCIAALDMSDLNEVGIAVTVHDSVGDNGNSNVGGNGKDDTDDSSYVFVNGSIEVTTADPAEKGVVNVDAISPKSDSADEFEQFQKEELGIENGSISVDPLVLETNGIVNGSATVEDPDLKAPYLVLVRLLCEKVKEILMVESNVQ